ncbi:hypothetical protein EDD15DRAFT_2196350 [Pisolithus albus]|nr:hypothetical protein EDD15DRAFT_2196350 [Pisolithus albus]
MPTHHTSSLANRRQSSTSYTLSEAIQEAPSSDNQTLLRLLRTNIPAVRGLSVFTRIQKAWSAWNLSTAPEEWSWSVYGRAVGAELSDTTTSVTSVSITSDMLGGLPMQTNPSYTWEDELFGGHGGERLPWNPGRKSCARVTAGLEYVKVPLKGSRYLSSNLVIVRGALLSMGMPPLFLLAWLKIPPLGLYRGALGPDKNGDHTADRNEALAIAQGLLRLYINSPLAVEGNCRNLLSVATARWLT